MRKRLFLIGILCLCLFAFVTNDATALRCRIVGGVLNCRKSLCAEQLMKSVKIDGTYGCISLLIEAAEVICCNPAEQCPEPPEGHPTSFFPNEPVSAAGLVWDSPVGENGKFLFEKCWELYENDALGNYLAENPPCNNNWTMLEQTLVATQVLAYFSGWQWDKQDKVWELMSEQCIRFITEPGDTPCGYEYIPDPAGTALDECYGENPADINIAEDCSGDWNPPE